MNDLDLFYIKVNLGNVGFYMGKSENYGFQPGTRKVVDANTYGSDEGI